MVTTTKTMTDCWNYERQENVSKICESCDILKGINNTDGDRDIDTEVDGTFTSHTPSRFICLFEQNVMVT